MLTPYTQCLAGVLLLIAGGAMTSAVEAASKAKVLQAKPEDVFAAALSLIHDDRRIAISSQDAEHMVLEFLVTVDSLTPADKSVSENWSGLRVHVSVEPTTGQAALLGIEVQRVGPATGELGRRASRANEAQESAYANQFFSRIRHYLKKKGTPATQAP